MSDTAKLLLEPQQALALIHHATTDLCVIDLRSEEHYLQGHIPGAVQLDPKLLMHGQPPGPGRLPSIERLQQLFSSLGLTEETHFIVYDDEGGGWAGRFIWTLDVIGHRHYSVINGGICAWRLEELPIEKESHRRTPQPVTLTIHTQPIAEIDTIMQGIEKQDIHVWDARSPAEYRGEKILAAKGGHIPGAINCEWTSLMDPEHGLRLRKDAKQRLQALGIDGSKTIITHCQSHHRSAYAYLVGKIFGFEIKGYHGSWSEWGNTPDAPVEI